MPIPQIYRKSAEAAIASYDYTDIAAGIGVQTFYACQAVMSGETLYSLAADSSIYSGAISEKDNKITSDLDYDVTFNLPRIIKGTIRVSVTQGVFGVGATDWVYLTISLYKVSGGTPTQIGTTERTIVTKIDGSVILSKTCLLEFETGGKIHFKKGDILRLKVIGVSNPSAHADSETGYGCDPADRNDQIVGVKVKIINDVDTTQLKVAVPFVIDL